MRLLIDRPIRKSIAEFLRGHLNHDVADSYGAEYQDFSDEEIVIRATQQNRIVITGDTGYRRRNRFPICTHSGIIVVRNRRAEDQETAFLKLARSPHVRLLEHSVSTLRLDEIRILREEAELRLHGDNFELLEPWER